MSLQSLTDTTHDTYTTDPGDVPLLNEGLQSTAKHLSVSQDLLVDESQAWDVSILEDFKRQRDTLVSMRDMFDRRDRYDTDNIPSLERRIQVNENRLIALRAKPENLVKPGETERVAEAIIKASSNSLPRLGMRLIMRIGQAVNCNTACSQCVCKRMHSRRAYILPTIPISRKPLEPGVGAGAGQVL